jgi:hypothetical protein
MIQYSTKIRLLDTNPRSKKCNEEETTSKCGQKNRIRRNCVYCLHLPGTTYWKKLFVPKIQKNVH